jgi:gliding motility-associated-like protein
MKLSLQIRAILTITLVAISQILFAQCPTITNVTTSTAVCAGGNITLEVTATSPDASTLSYAWFKNGAAIPSATSRRYEITNFQAANADVYFVKVSNACNTPTQSANITLTLKDKPSINSFSTSPQTICAGSNYTIQVSGNDNGGGTITYQWEKGASIISNSNAATYTLTNIQSGDAALYSVILSNSCGNVTSSDFQLNVNQKPSITVSPNPINVLCVGATLTLNADVISATSFKWQKDGADIGNTTKTLTIPSVAASSAGVYTFVATNDCGNSTSGSAQVTIKDKPSITTITAPTNVCAGATASLVSTVVANGDNNLTYAWALNGTAVPNGNGATLVVPNFQSANAGTYSFTVTNSCGSTSSTTNNQNVTIQLITTPSIATISNQNVCINTSLLVATTITNLGSTSPTYQWYFNGTAISGQTGAQLNISNIQTAKAGRYYVTVNNGCSPTISSNEFNVTVLDAPSIQTQPTAQTEACSSTSFTLSVEANNTQSYQWLKNDVAINLATSSTFNIPSVVSSDAATYKVVVSNSCGSNVTSNAAVLVVKSEPTIQTLASSNTLCVGASQTLQVNALTNNGGTLTYQWKKAGVNILNATTATLALTSLQTGNAGVYTVDVTNSCRTVTSPDYTIVISQAPIITLDPISQSLCAGATVTFTANVTGSTSVKWQRNGVDVGNTTATLSISNIAAANAGSYTFVATNSCGTTTSAAATLAVNNKPVINSLTTTSPVCAGATATITSAVTPNGDNNLTYAWSFGGNVIGNTATLSIPNFQSANAGTYALVVTNSCGSSTGSSTTTLQLQPTPAVADVTDQTVCLGNSLNVAPVYTNVSGSSVSYQWYFEGNVLNGQTAAQLNISNITTSQAGRYFVSVNNGCNPVSGVPFNVIVLNTPSIQTQPTAQTEACSSTSFTLSVAANNTQSYQWLKNDVAINLATSSTFNIPSVTGADAATYKVVVSNTCGFNVTSNAAVLVVKSAPTVQTTATTSALCVGASQTLQVNALTNNGGTLTYQWKKAGVNIPNATTATLALTNIQTGDAAVCTVAVTNSCGSTTSPDYTITISQAPIITLDPLSQSLCAGATVTFTASVTGATSFKWQKNGVDVGNTTNTLSISNIAATNAGSYTFVATNSCGTTTSAAATLAVNNKPVINSLTTSSPVCAGATATITSGVNPNGDNNLTYSWSLGGTIISGANTSVLSIPNFQSANAGTYALVVTNSCGSSTGSSTTTLQLQPTPAVANIADKSVCLGGTLNAAPVYTGVSGSTVTYQWYFESTALNSQTAAQLNISNIQITQAGRYYVVVNNGCGPVSGTPFNVNVINLPSIQTQPTALTEACSATNFTLSVAANNTQTYQWLKNDVAINTATSSTFNIPSVANSDAATYKVVISNSCGYNVTSNAAVLVVKSAPTVQTLATSNTLCVGASQTLQVNALTNNGGTLTYQWKKGGVNIPNATTPSLALTNLQTSDAATYTVDVTNSCGTTPSPNFVITMTQAPIITLDPLSQSLCAGATVTFTANVTGATSFKWQRNGVDVGNTTNTLSISNIAAANAGSYTFVATNSCGNTTSAAATLAVNNKPVINSLTTTSPVCAGATATITSAVTPNGDNNLTYSWSLGGSVIVGANTGTLSIPNFQSANAGTYALVVTNSCGSSTGSSTTTLQLQQAPAVANLTDPTICQGGTLNVAPVYTNVSGSNISYQWYFEGNVLNGQTASQLNISNITTSQAGRYFVTVNNGCAPISSTAFNVSVFNLPAIQTQPSAQQQLCVGTNFTLTVAANNAQTYQWYKNNVVITGETSSTYTKLVAASDAGTYKVIISNACGYSLTSNNAILTVNTSPTITSAPANTTVCVGQPISASVSASANGGGNLRYVWTTGSTEISGATGSTFSIARASTNDAKTYTVAVTNDCGTTNGGNFTVTVGDKPTATITTGIPKNDVTGNPTVCIGAPITFSVESLSNGYNASYTWYKDDISKGTSTSNALSISSSATTDAGTYKLSVSNTCGVTTSNLITIGVHEKPIIAIHPEAAITACEVTTVNINGLAQNKPGTNSKIEYTWFYNNNPYSSNGSNLSLTNVNTDQTGNYQLKVSNECGSTTSNAAVLTVVSKPKYSVTTAANDLAICSATYQTKTISVNIFTINGSVPNITWSTSDGSITAFNTVGNTANVTVASVGKDASYFATLSNACGTTDLHNFGIKGIKIVNEASTPSVASYSISPATTFCEKDQIKLNVTTKSTAAETYTWKLNNIVLITQSGSTNSQDYTKTVATVADQGTYTVDITNKCGTLANAVSIPVTVNPTPVVAFDVSSAINQCLSNNQFDFTNRTVVTNGSTIQYVWDFGDGGRNTTAVNATSHSYSSSGTYTVKLNGINNYSCTGNTTRVITVLAQPRVTKQPIGKVVCQGDEYELITEVETGGATSLSYQWYLNNQPISNTLNSNSLRYKISSMSPANEGVYYLKITNAQCNLSSESERVTVSYQAKPNPSFTAGGKSFNSCINDAEYTFINTTPNVANVSYLWKVDDGSTSRETNFTYKFTSIGIYEVSLTATAGGCSSGAVYPLGNREVNKIRVNTIPTITSDLVSSLTINKGNPINISITAIHSYIDGTNPSPSITYQWYKLPSTTVIYNDRNYNAITSAVISDTGRYYAQARNACGFVRSNIITIKVFDKPSITIQPAATKACIDNALQLTVDAISNDNTSPLYQWYYQQDLNTEAVIVPGATGPILNISKFKISNAGHYYVTLTNSVGATTSDKVIVTANDVPQINSVVTTPSIESGVCINTALQLNASVSNLANSTNIISWEQNGVTIPGQASLELNFASIAKTNNGDLILKVANACGTASKTMNIKVIDLPQFTQSPVAVTTCVNGVANFTAKVQATTDGTPFGFQWLKNGTAYTGTGIISDEKLSLSNVLAADAGFYALQATNACGITTSATGKLTVIAAGPTITQQPTAINSCAGTQNTVSIVATSEDNTLTYSWYKNGIEIANETTAQLIFKTIATSEAGTYKAVVTNGCGLATTSNNFIVVVKEKVSLNGTIANKELCVGNSLTQDISSYLNSADINTTYQWRLNDIDLTEVSARTNSLSLQGITKSKEGKYSVIIINSCGTSTLNLFSLKVNAAPEITTQPIPGLVCEGGSFTNNVIANNSTQLPLSYQWLKDGTVIANNAIAQQLQLQNITGSDQGLYAVRVSNSCGTTLSASARLSLIGNPVITQQPAAINSCSGIENTATIVATSDDNRLTYKWFKNGSLIAGQIGSQLNFPNVTATDAGSYKAIVTNGCNLSTTSSDFLVFVKEKIALNGAIANKQLCVGNTLDVDLAAYLTGGDVSSRYQWRLNSIDLTEASAKTTRLQLLNVAKTNQGAYSLIATNGCGPSTLNLFNLTINTVPEITTQPVAGFVCEGKTFTNNVIVANATQLPLSYQWFKDGNSIANNATAQQLVLQNIAAADQGLYAVRVSNSCGTTQSSSARLSLIGNPLITQQPVSITSCAGIENTATIVGTSDDNALVYKWYKNGILLPDQIGNQLVFSKILITDIGAYKSVISNSCGLSATSNTFQIVVNDKVKLNESITDKVVCVGSDFETDLTSNLKGADLSSKYQWKLNGIDIVSNSAKTNKIQLLNVTKSNSGKYSILATNNCGANTIDLFALGITNLPVIETHPIEGSICENLDWTNKVVTSNTDQIGFTYQWFKDGVALSGATQPTLYVANTVLSNKGLYSVKLSSACGDVISQSALLQVRPTPQIDIALVGTPPMQCIDNNTFVFKPNVFISDNSNVDLTWDFGDGVTSKQSQVSHNYNFANDFNVYLFAKSIYGCKDTATQVISINTKPVITGNIVNQILCTGAQLNYNVDVKVKPNEKIGYQWYFNQDPILNAVNKSISIDNVQKVNGGNYKLRIANACGITYSTEAEIKIAEKPIVTVPLPINFKVCENTEIVLKPTIYSLLPNSFQWYKNELPFVGRESDTLRIKQFGNQDVATYSVSIANKCGTTFAIPGNLIMKNVAWSTQSLVSDTICYQTDTKLALKDFANNDDTLIFSWFKDGLPLTGANTKDFSINKFIINDTGYYAAKLTNSCGILNVPVAKLTLNKVNAAFSLDTLDACKGSLIINGLDTTRSFFRIRDNYWQIKELNRTLGSTPGMRFQFSNSGTYTIRHAVTDIKGCNSDTVSKIVINYGKPTASFTINDTCMTTPSIALNNSVFGYASSKLTKYTWNFGDTTIIRNTNVVPSYTYKTAGPKSLQLIVESDSSCVADTMTKKLMIYGNPVASFVTQDSCQGFPVLFTNRSFTQFAPDSVVRFSWNFDDGVTSALRNPQNIFKQYGAYKIKLTAFSASCPFLTDDTTINMTIKSPRANQVYPRIQTVKRVIGQLNAVGNGRSYAWLPFTGLTDTKIKNPKFSIIEDKLTYTITITDSAGCVNNDKQEVWAFNKPDIYLATGFSPNNDGVNDKYKPEYIEIKILEYFRVQDSNNRQVFITNSLTDKWDGTYNGNKLPPAPYLVSVAGIDILGNRIVKQGIVLVVK